MNKTILSIVTVMIMSLFLQSCFEIKEIITINKDGSGNFTMSIDMSEVKEMVENFSGGKNDDKGSPLAEMQEEFEATREKLAIIEGISNINFVTENEGYVISTGFDFNNIDALNRGMNVVYEDENEDGTQTEYYKLKKKIFERTLSHNLLDQLKEEMGSGDIGAEGMDLATIFSDVAYVNVVTFTDRKVKKTSSDEIKISDDGSTMTLKRFIFRKDADLSMDYKVKVK